eukprot:TRINITY_DN27830_c0_g1_i1.p1 TRINITY_DN27830_c0_g1~~TRINITY_DN27830_c0_g1_i1.p1  ORF type:complete len:392 (+),score=81.08 TRINITY_DN27830_c0_g1_i1:88-1263(+)
MAHRCAAARGTRLAAAALALGHCRACTHFGIRRTTPGTDPLWASAFEGPSADATVTGTSGAVTAHGPGSVFSPLPGCPPQSLTVVSRQLLVSMDPGRVVYEGMNAAGVTVSSQSLRVARYEAPAAGREVLCWLSLPAWVLGSFASVAELAAALGGVTVSGDPPPLSGQRLQWIVQDASGADVLLECLSGTCRLRNSSVSVVTNDPPLDWHLSNLNNYVAVGAEAPQVEIAQTQTEVGTVPYALSAGLNLAALPGGFTPAARFARVFYLRELALLRRPPASPAAAEALAAALLSSVHVVQGTVANTTPGKWEATQYAVIKQPSRRQFRFRAYASTQWSSVDVGRVRLPNATASHSIPLPYSGSLPADVTSLLSQPARGHQRHSAAEARAALL